MMRLLICGAGVIGSFYAALVITAGKNTSGDAGGETAGDAGKGRFVEHNGQLHSAHVEVIDRAANEDHFDYIFLTVKGNQVHTALRELRPDCRCLLCGRASQGGVARKSCDPQNSKAAETQFQDTSCTGNPSFAWENEPVLFCACVDFESRDGKPNGQSVLCRKSKDSLYMDGTAKAEKPCNSF